MKIYAFIAAMLLACTANASLIGDNVDIDFFSDSFGPNPTSVVVGPGQETSFYGNFGIDIGDFFVQITMLNGGFCGFTCNGDPATLTVSGMDFSDFSSIVAVNLIDGGMAPFNASFTGSSISFQMPDIPLNTGMFARLEFRTGDSVDVPVPGTIALLGLGLVGLALSRRKKASV